MNKIFHAEQSSKTPLIELNPETGVFEIRGKSIPENTVIFYKPMFEWIDSYSLDPVPQTAFDIQLDYFNTSSAKILADILRKMEKLHASGKSSVTINWRYQDIDDDMLEAGEGFQSITKVPFNLISFT